MRKSKRKKNETCGKQQEYFCEEIFIFLTNKTMFHNKNRKNRREKLLDPQETIDSIELCLDWLYEDKKHHQGLKKSYKKLQSRKSTMILCHGKACLQKTFGAANVLSSVHNHIIEISLVFIIMLLRSHWKYVTGAYW